MVATPWGNSNSLRDRRLKPGPGIPREDVVSNQRERLFGAMVASVYERGYAATTVADLVKISGVSSRTFYDLFPDKQACFVAALEGIIQAALAFAAQSINEVDTEAEPAGVRLPDAPADPPVSWEEQARRSFDAFAEMIAAQPAAARMALIEAYAAGPEALVPVEQAVAGFEWLTLNLAEQSPELAGMPPEMITAHIGAQQEITRTRLRRGTQAELPKLSDDLWNLMLSYSPPPKPLRRTGRPPKPQPESVEAHDHAERALRAFTAVVAEQGYVNTTVDAVLKRAQMSATTFYAHFRGKEEAMLAAIDSAGAQIVAAVLPAYRRTTNWPEGVRAAFGALFSFLASRPGLARLIAVEVYAAEPQAVERRAQTLRPLEQLVAEGKMFVPGVPPVAVEAITGAVYTLAYRQIQKSGPSSLPSLAPLCTYVTLSPFIGPEHACAAANEEPVASGAEAPYSMSHLRSPSIDPMLSKIMMRLTEEPSSPARIAVDLGVPVEEILRQVAGLERIGLLRAEGGKEGNPADRLYSADRRIHDADEVAGTSPDADRMWSTYIRDSVLGDIDLAMESGAFFSRSDRCDCRIPVVLDELGWQTLSDLHVSMVAATLEIEAESAARLEKSGERGIRGRSIQYFFEMPSP